MDLGIKIANLRSLKRVSMTDLAKSASISVSYLNDIEKGRSNPSLDTLSSIARALGMSSAELIRDTEFDGVKDSTPIAAHYEGPPGREIKLDQKMLEEEFRKFLEWREKRNKNK